MSLHAGVKITLVVFVTVVMLSGCLTSATLQEAAGSSMSLSFYRTDDDQVRIFWREKPFEANTQLTVSRMFEGCDDVRMFVNPTRRARHELTDDGVRVRPARHDTRYSVVEQWRHLPEGPCVLLISAGQVTDELFSGVLLSTREGVFQRFELGMSGKVEAHPSALVMLPWIWLIYEPVSTVLAGPAHVAYAMSADAPPEISVTISFEFPDRDSRSVSLTTSQALNLLKEPFYREVSDYEREPWRNVRFWVRAALVELGFDFREQSTIRADRTVYFNQLVYVDGYRGEWRYHANGRSRRGLNADLGSAREIRVAMD